MKVNQKGFSVVEILIVAVIVGSIGLAGWLAYDRQKNTADNNATNAQTAQQNEETFAQEQVEPKSLARGTFGDNGDYGTLQAEGYATTIEAQEAFCENNCPQYDYVFFNITKTENTNIYSYLKNRRGNSFVQDKAIGMGCLLNGKISYSNSSDEKGIQEYSLSEEETSEIMNATADNPITLELERLQHSGGRGAPTCTSLFTTFDLIE